MKKCKLTYKTQKPHFLSKKEQRSLEKEIASKRLSKEEEDEAVRRMVAIIKLAKRYRKEVGIDTI